MKKLIFKRGREGMKRVEMVTYRTNNRVVKSWVQQHKERSFLKRIK